MKRVVSGMRPTGYMHLGHLHGVMNHWVKLQEEYQCFYFIADLHALTTEYKNPVNIKNLTLDLFAEWLSVGLSPEKSVLFVQSKVPQHAELHVYLSMITPVSWLERNPTYKEMREELKGKDLSTYGFLGYPVLQTADILVYKGEFVPVGQDQLPHLEISREIARRFNYLYGNGKKVLPEPQALLTETPKILGVDGRKMSKSFGNAIFIREDPESIKEKIKIMFTDTQRKRRSDPGRPSVCNVFTLHKYYTPEDKVKEIEEECQRAGIGCVDCKKILTENLLRGLAPIREKIFDFLDKKGELMEIMEEGCRKAREEAEKVMAEVKEVIGF